MGPACDPLSRLLTLRSLTAQDLISYLETLVVEVSMITTPICSSQLQQVSGRSRLRDTATNIETVTRTPPNGGRDADGRMFGIVHKQVADAGRRDQVGLAEFRSVRIPGSGHADQIPLRR